MTYTVKIKPLLVDASSVEEALELATDYFKGKEFKVRLSEIEEGQSEV